MPNERKRMTESTTTEQKLCIVGGGTDSPCPFPATVALPHRRLPEGEWLCAYHAATEPLVAESNEIGLCLELVRAYLKGARRQRAGRLVEVLERAEADFLTRHALAEKVLNDLRAAERKLMRG
jgi:hypothetical protein